jgi:1-acyl-sn-glycerol-3-phosphate acyltransferase
VSNHPTLIDTLFMLAWMPRLTCVVKGSWYERFVLRWLMRGTNYIPGPGYAGDEEEETPVFDRMVEHLQKGFPLLVFPEGTRAPPDTLLRFRRGGFEAAIRARVPILPVFIGVDNAGLTKGVPLSPRLMTYTFEPMPWTDTRTGEHDARDLCAHYAALYETRHRRYLADRDATSSATASSVSDNLGSRT